MNSFSYNNKTTVLLGKNIVEQQLQRILSGYGKRVMLAYGFCSIKRNGIYDELINILRIADKEVIEFSGIMPNPTYKKVQEGAQLARKNKVDLILSVGGGSVSDAGKIISAQAKTDSDIWDMETKEGKMPTDFIPMVTVVTLFGTGSEMNDGAVITNEELKIKRCIRGAQADFALIDPTYTMSVTPRQMFSCIFDTLSHAMETYFGRPSKNNLSDDICEAVMRSVIKNAKILLNDYTSYEARSELAWASAMAENGILKIGKVTDFQAHQIEHQLGAYTDCNHGMGLAIVHPALYRHIFENDIPKFARFAKNVWGIDNESEHVTAQLGITALQDFIKEIGLPTRLCEIGITEDSLLRKVADSTNISIGCCKELTADEIYDILLECK